ncbi:MAG: hypothetical protein KA155_10350 [Alphaproteobacteria bacterium]|jgi:hypothetical protein|nr:hypothetical protein [Alphaproteobacteria bacterium]
MPDSVIPEDIRGFIARNIDSIAQLEGLLLLRANPEILYNTTTIAERLYISDAESEWLLQDMYERGLIGKNESSEYFYQPHSPELAAMVEKLSDIYSRYLLAVTHFIHSKSKSRVQEFANAFWIRKDKN